MIYNIWDILLNKLNWEGVVVILIWVFYIKWWIISSIAVWDINIILKSIKVMEEYNKLNSFKFFLSMGSID
jgi:hypothetical protein